MRYETIDSLTTFFIARATSSKVNYIVVPFCNSWFVVMDTDKRKKKKKNYDLCP